MDWCRGRQRTTDCTVAVHKEIVFLCATGEYDVFRNNMRNVKPEATDKEIVEALKLHVHGNLWRNCRMVLKVW